jgi:hypothetical protein
MDPGSDSNFDTSLLGGDAFTMHDDDGAIGSVAMEDDDSEDEIKREPEEAEGSFVTNYSLFFFMFAVF